ncbi:ARM repeat superfamily protein [Abeliophyllum distichum]|uniref:ARM repeat superfamily protein n=1 Tax=Abeliophyllum distichum TaxID=126358 RepID=A0ABD1QIZ7_9LAMI
MEEYRGKLKAITGGVEEEDVKDNNIFSELKHYCIQLLDVLQNPKKISSSAFSQLLQLLQRSLPDSLQPFFDYTLFPLLLLLDAAVNCRTSLKANSEDRSLLFDALETPHNVSDAVAEATLLCLEELLKKCCLGSVDQMVVILKKLTHGVLLSPSEASEEFREGVIRCFKALLLNLHSCSDESCPCKQICGCPTLLGRDEVQFSCARVSKYDLVPEQCLLAFLQSEPASAIVGHWLSLLLKAADVEATRGHRGSSRLRVEAFLALRVLVAKVGSADALAFYLPGVVSQIGKVLHVSKTMISGAAGSMEALDHAIRGFAEYLIIVLEDDANISSLGIIVNDSSDLSSSEEKPLASFLEELRNLPVKNQGEDEITAKDLTKSVEGAVTVSGFREKASGNSDRKVGSLRVKRTREWIVNTSAHVDKLLSATFPHLCVHPTKRVRQGLLVAVQALLSKCSYTLKESRLMLLECLCVLVCDDSEEVSSAAQAFFRHMFSSSGKHQLERDVAEVFSRLVEKLPQVLLGSEESLALSHARKLLSITYFCGPQLVADYLLHSPVRAARFLDVFSLCLSQNSIFAGSLDKLVSARPSSTGFMRSIAELKAVIDDSEPLGVQNRKMLFMPENVKTEYEIPRMPPWFVNVGSHNLYQALAGILRLVARSLFADSQIEGSLSIIVDIPLGHLRKLISEIRMKEYHKESWQSWYKRTGSGQMVRQASIAACILNEMIFGLSDQAMTNFRKMFEKSSLGQQDIESFYADGNDISCEFVHAGQEEYVWNIDQDSGARSHLIDCIGSILHEYLSTEIWDLPLGLRASLQQSDGEDRDITSRASDAVLHVISAIHGCASVGHLVLANSDYVIDSICQQLRHLDLNPHVPNVLAAMLSYVGVADKVLPLLEEPMRAVSMELEILGRHQHPNLTTSFLKAVSEIAKASKYEASTLPNKADSFGKDVNFSILNVEKITGKLSTSTSYVDNPKDINYMESETGSCSNSADMQMEEWESILFKLNDSKRFRRIVGSIAGSCLIAVTPLIASSDQAACLIALDVVEDGIVALAKVEEAYKHESKTKEAIEGFIHSWSLHTLQDTLDAPEDETGENRLLPAMNKIWPFLVACVRNKNPVTIRRCSHAISTVVQICGGEFFSRRFHADGTHFWKLLSTSPFQKKPFSREERTPLQLPYRSNSTSSEDSVSEISNLKVQAELLNMISDLARNKRSASALEAVLKKVSGLVVGIACSGVKGLLDASINALVGLACVDPDLIWLLLSDVYYSRKKDLPLPPTSEFPDITEILPPPSCSKEYLYVLYGGQSYGFDIDFTSVETVFKKLHAQVLTKQIYS